MLDNPIFVMENRRKINHNPGPELSGKMNYMPLLHVSNKDIMGFRVIDHDSVAACALR